MVSKRNSIENLMNIGPKVAEGLAEIGIETEYQLREMGAVEAFCRMRMVDPKWNHKMLLYALHGALIGVNCLQLDEDIKRNLNEQVG